MINESRQKLILRLKKRFEGITDKFNVHSYKEELSGENASLILFSEFLRKAIEGVEFVLANSFNNSNQYKDDSPIRSIVPHIYTSSILFYSKMFRGGKGVKRENIVLKENKLFDSEGNVRVQQNGTPIQPRQNRFYIEEFFMHNSVEFKNHHKILFQIDKSLAHIDKTDLTSCYTLLLFDKKESPNYLGIDNYFEYHQLPTPLDLFDYSNLFKKLRHQVNQNIHKNATIIHESFKTKTNYNNYYEDLIIMEDEI